MASYRRVTMSQPHSVIVWHTFVKRWHAAYNRHKKKYIPHRVRLKHNKVPKCLDKPRRCFLLHQWPLYELFCSCRQRCRNWEVKNTQNFTSKYYKLRLKCFWVLNDVRDKIGWQLLATRSEGKAPALECKDLVCRYTDRDDRTILSSQQSPGPSLEANQRRKWSAYLQRWSATNKETKICRKYEKYTNQPYVS